jgi:hypothetical protein
MKKPKEIAPKSIAEEEAAEAQILELSKRIEFYITEYSVELLANKMHDGDFFVPTYQREFTWEPERKSKFIESLLIGLPIPFLFFWERSKDGKLEIVDGSQRLRTIEEFVLGGFRLGGLESLTAVSGFAFSDLPESRRRKIKNRSIRGIVLNENADEQARFDMFERINTGSKIANKAEVRRGALGGPFMDLIIALSTHPKFVALAPVPTKAVQKREREELVARFFAYSDGLEGYRDRPSEFVFKYVKKMNEEVASDPNKIERYRSRFLELLDFVERVFPHGFRRTPEATASPRARFEAIAVGSRLALDARPALAEQEFVSAETWLSSKEFKSVTGSDGANAIARLRDRIDFVRNRLLAGA